MKSSNRSLRTISALGATLLLVVASGCATGSGGARFNASNQVPLPAGVTLTQHPHLQGVWVAPGFNFTGYDAVVVATPGFKAVERPNEVNERAMAIRSLQETVVTALRDSGAFPTVVTRPDEVKPGIRAAVIETTIVEYEKGGGAGRYFAGIYGAGQPVLRVRGQLVDPAGAPLFVFEARRSGESASARMFGGFRSDVEIQAEDIRDLGVDLRDFVVQQRKTGK